MIILENEYVSVRRNESDISYYDKTDKYNDFKGFTRNIRGLDKATKFLQQVAQDERLKDDIKMGDITTILTNAKLRPHTYCGVD